MKLLLCGKTDECLLTIDLIKSPNADIETEMCENVEQLFGLLKLSCYDMAVVLFDGADGMETVMSIRRQQPHLPVVWLSNDKGFAAQSYRLGTAYFHSKPITQQIMKKVLTMTEVG